MSKFQRNKKETINEEKHYFALGAIENLDKFLTNKKETIKEEKHYFALEAIENLDSGREFQNLCQ